MAQIKDFAGEIHRTYTKGRRGYSNSASASGSGTAKWERPPPNWVKLNTDASILGNNSRAAIGGVVNDSEGRWMWGFSSKIGSMDVDSAELCAVRMGLQIAWEHRIPKIIVKMDSATVYNWLTCPVKVIILMLHPISKCLELSQKPWDCKFKLIC